MAFATGRKHALGGLKAMLVLGGGLGIAGCPLDGDRGPEGALPLVFETEETERGVRLTSTTIEPVDIHYSTDPECDWDNASVCENGGVEPDLGDDFESLSFYVDLEDELFDDQRWFAKAFTEDRESEVVSFRKTLEPAALFGASACDSSLIHMPLATEEAEVLPVPDNAGESACISGVAGDSARGYAYFSYLSEGDDALIARVKLNVPEPTPEVVMQTESVADYMVFEETSNTLYATDREEILAVDLTDPETPDSRVLIDGGRYGGIAWNPDDGTLLAVAEGENSSGCQLLVIDSEGASEVLAEEVDEDCNYGVAPVAVDGKRDMAYVDFDMAGVVAVDLATGERSELPLADYSGRALGVSPDGDTLYYRGQLNTVHRRSLDDADEDVEILDEDAPSPGRGIAVVGAASAE